MGSRAFLVALMLGGALVAAHAKCTALDSQPDDEDPDAPDLGACKRCSADGSVCEECWTTYAVNSTGQCTRCNNPNQCYKCKGDDPSFCLECGDYWGEEETSYFATKAGTCKPCYVKHCAKCKSITGECIVCDSGMGVMPDGTCQTCKDDNCLSCNGDRNVCSPVDDEQACMSGYFLEAGVCKKCSPHCEKCKDANTCLECDSQGYGLRNGTCAPCASKGCTSCPANPTVCEECDTGYHLNSNALCEPCASKGCNECPNSADVCESCAWRFTNMSDFSCAKCTDPRCATCTPDNPDRCEVCNANLELESNDPWNGGPNEEGACVPCAVKGCQDCQKNYKVCDVCKHGFFDAELGQCRPCKDRWAHCAACGTDATEEPEVPACFNCEDGWQLDDSAPRGKRTCLPLAKLPGRKALPAQKSG